MGSQILLIDDSAMLRRIAASALRAQPARYEVVSATRASEGFARACGGEAAVIVLDERLAGNDDAEMCRRLLDEPRTSGVPVVLLTGRRGDASKLASLPANVVDLLSKPFAPAQLVGAINAVVDLAKHRANFGEMRRRLHPEGRDNDAGPEAGESPDARTTACAPVRALRPSETSIVSALLAVTSEGATGVLRFSPVDGIPTEVFIENGGLLLVTTRDGVAYSEGAADYLPAKVSPATLQDAAAEQGHTGVPFLLGLGARGVVSKAAGVALLRQFGQRHFARLWMIPTGSLQITFEPLDAMPGYTLRLEAIWESVGDWLLDGLRLLTAEDLASEARHQGLVGTPTLLRRGESLLKELKMNETERAFAAQVDGRRDLPTIARNLGVSPVEVFGLVHRFRCLELLAYRPAPLPFVVTPRTSMRRILPLKR